ncbi:MAG: rhodanese-like domain-containing protein [Alphaproteobacteria bacterium]|nr:rhodanese-like domain-containing protein [Alphaproteobacteria bacterium]
MIHYAADLTAREAFDTLSHDGSAILVDVRTPEEWARVGIPDLSSLNKNPELLIWTPDEHQHPQFAARVKELVPAGDTKVIFLCRSGVRSVAAANYLAELGHSQCYNILGGFEGVNGWKASNLPCGKV